jgi:hypothetical protein
MFYFILEVEYTEDQKLSKRVSILLQGNSLISNIEFLLKKFGQGNHLKYINILKPKIIKQFLIYH